jgi:LacI family transcriptional regulator
MRNSQNVTIKDVARLAGVSISTASRALTGAGGVSPALEKSILDAANKLCYRPNLAARGLRRSRTLTLGIVFNNLRGPGQLDLLKGVGGACNASGFGLLAADADGDHQQYLSLIRRFFEQRVEGLFLVSPIDLGDSLLDYRRASVPVIALLGKDSSAGATPLVGPSERHGINDAMGALVGLGHREIGYVLRSWDEVRLREINEALASAGLTASDASVVVPRNYDDAVVHESVTRALSGAGGPTALVVHSILLASTVAAVHDMKLSVPQDVSLVSIGASSWNQVFDRSMSAVEADSRAIGQNGCRVMLDWIGGKEPVGDYSELAVWRPRSSITAASRSPARAK